MAWSIIASAASIRILGYPVPGTRKRFTSARRCKKPRTPGQAPLNGTLSIKRARPKRAAAKTRPDCRGSIRVAGLPHGRRPQLEFEPQRRVRDAPSRSVQILPGPHGFATAPMVGEDMAIRAPASSGKHCGKGQTVGFRTVAPTISTGMFRCEPSA